VGVGCGCYAIRAGLFLAGGGAGPRVGLHRAVVCALQSGLGGRFLFRFGVAFLFGLGRLAVGFGEKALFVVEVGIAWGALTADRGRDRQPQRLQRAESTPGLGPLLHLAQREQLQEREAV
jgi:hypothetical protein